MAIKEQATPPMPKIRPPVAGRRETPNIKDREIMSNEHTQGQITVRTWGGTCDLESADDTVIAVGIGTADAKRLAACWNAFDGVDTGKIEGKDIAEYMAGEAYLHSAGPGDGSFDMQFNGKAMVVMAASVAGLFEGCGAENFIEFGMTHPSTGDFLVTIQRRQGETPTQQKAAALAERDVARHDLATARALLAGILKADDEARAELDALGIGCDAPEAVSLTERIRTFLEPKA